MLGLTTIIENDEYKFDSPIAISKDGSKILVCNDMKPIVFKVDDPTQKQQLADDVALGVGGVAC